MATNEATRRAPAAKETDSSTVRVATFPSSRMRYSTTECEEARHEWSYVGVVFGPRLNFIEPRKITELVYRCDRCGRLGKRPVPEKPMGMFDRKIVKLPEFRANARDVFGWSLRDRLQEKDTGNEKL